MSDFYILNSKVNVHFSLIMGNTFPSKTLTSHMIDEYDSDGFKALGVPEWFRITSSMLSMFTFDDSIKDDCYKIIDNAYKSKKKTNFTIYLDGRTVMCIKYRDQVHISAKAMATTFGYTHNTK